MGGVLVFRKIMSDSLKIRSNRSGVLALRPELVIGIARQEVQFLLRLALETIVSEQFSVYLT
jgi:hypothetical protein